MARRRRAPSRDRSCDLCHTGGEGLVGSELMKRAYAAMALAAGIGLVALPAFTFAMGGGGGGGGGMPSGGSMGGMGGMPDQPRYDPAEEYQKGTADLQA